jgi:phospholipid/cholesterol/gamma-HCH transport system substrate-binding protein
MAETRSPLMNLSAEAKVGLFVLIGIILLVYMSLRIGGISLGRAEGYQLNVRFRSAAGLDKDASVRVAGVEVGRVKEIILKDNMAHLVLLVQSDIKVGRDFTALLTTKGLLGEKYVELVPGSPNAPFLKDGDTITRTTSYADMDMLITIMSEVSGDIKKVTEVLSSVFGGVEGEATLKNIFTNIEEISSRVNRLIASNDEKLGRVLKNVTEFTTLLREEGPRISSGLAAAVENLNREILRTSKNMNAMIEDNRAGISEGVQNLRVAAIKFQEAMDNINQVTRDIAPKISGTVNSIGRITSKIDRGEGTIGKLVNDESMYDNINKTVTGINRFLDKAESFHTFIGYRGEYLLDADETKNYFTLKIQPSEDKFYLFEIVDDPRGLREKDEKTVVVNGVTTTTTETRTSDEFKFTIQMAKRFKGITIRGGLIESSGGVGLDMHMFGRRVKLSLEAFDFGKDDNVHMKAGAIIQMGRFFFLSAGYDDFASEEGFESAYLGLGLEFEDEDLKYLLSSAPPVSF